jgi:Zn-dependent alcohol dehydrogenase
MKVPVGATVAIFRVGAVGLAAIMAAKVADAATIIAIDVNEPRLELAKALGATHVVNAAAAGGVGVSAAIRQIEQRGVEFVLDTSGRASNLDAGVGALAPLGHFGFVAFSSTRGRPSTRRVCVFVNDWAKVYDGTDECGFKQSGLGRLNGHAALDDFIEYKHIALEPGLAGPSTGPVR